MSVIAQIVMERVVKKTHNAQHLVAVGRLNDQAIVMTITFLFDHFIEKSMKHQNVGVLKNQNIFQTNIYVPHICKIHLVN